MTHSSSSVSGSRKLVCNERLEFLGDAVLGSVISDFLYSRFRKEREGFLSKSRSNLVCRERLNELALAIGLDKFVTACGLPTMHNNYPIEEPNRYISVANKEEKEIGMVMDIATFPKAQRQILHAELSHRYFMPTILSIDSLNDRFGHTVFQVKTNIGPLRFTVRDVYRNLFRLPDGRIILTDVDQNRYEIPDPKALDAKSYKRIELYI